MTKLGETCKHGCLRRSCETCDLAEQLDAALLKLDRLRRVVSHFERDELDDGDAFEALCSILEETK